MTKLLSLGGVKGLAISAKSAKGANFFASDRRKLQLYVVNTFLASSSTLVERPKRPGRAWSSTNGTAIATFGIIA